MTVISLDQLLTPRQAAQHINREVARVILLDRLPSATAYRLVCERITDGDPHVLAAVGQTWTMRPEFSSLWEWPRGRELQVHQRLQQPASVVVTDEHGITSTAPLTGLQQMYELTAWRWTE
ncbi:hypothetical protein [Kitasatospora sp. KL5]|uniref:hypothetical protein n=1 Tax=Kitasatospora sp. KL5 TaxID=3425125 RepID=UPI003D6FB371